MPVQTTQSSPLESLHLSVEVQLKEFEYLIQQCSNVMKQKKEAKAEEFKHPRMFNFILSNGILTTPDAATLNKERHDAIAKLQELPQVMDTRIHGDELIDQLNHCWIEESEEMQARTTSRLYHHFLSCQKHLTTFQLKLEGLERNTSEYNELEKLIAEEYSRVSLIVSRLRLLVAPEKKIFPIQPLQIADFAEAIDYILYYQSATSVIDSLFIRLQWLLSSHRQELRRRCFELFNNQNLSTAYSESNVENLTENLDHLPTYIRSMKGLEKAMSCILHNLGITYDQKEDAGNVLLHGLITQKFPQLLEQLFEEESFRPERKLDEDDEEEEEEEEDENENDINQKRKERINRSHIILVECPWKEMRKQMIPELRSFQISQSCYLYEEVEPNKLLKAEVTFYDVYDEALIVKRLQLMADTYNQRAQESQTKVALTNPTLTKTIAKVFKTQQVLAGDDMDTPSTSKLKQLLKTAVGHQKLVYQDIVNYLSIRYIETRQNISQLLSCFNYFASIEKQIQNFEFAEKWEFDLYNFEKKIEIRDPATKEIKLYSCAQIDLKTIQDYLVRLGSHYLQQNQRASEGKQTPVDIPNLYSQLIQWEVWYQQAKCNYIRSIDQVRHATIDRHCLHILHQLVINLIQERPIYDFRDASFVSSYTKAITHFEIQTKLLDQIISYQYSREQEFASKSKYFEYRVYPTFSKIAQILQLLNFSMIESLDQVYRLRSEFEYSCLVQAIDEQLIITWDIIQQESQMDYINNTGQVQVLNFPTTCFNSSNLEVIIQHKLKYSNHSEEIEYWKLAYEMLVLYDQILTYHYTIQLHLRILNDQFQSSVQTKPLHYFLQPSSWSITILDNSLFESTKSGQFIDWLEHHLSNDGVVALQAALQSEFAFYAITKTALEYHCSFLDPILHFRFDSDCTLGSDIRRLSARRNDIANEEMQSASKYEFPIARYRQLFIETFQEKYHIKRQALIALHQNDKNQFEWNTLQQQKQTQHQLLRECNKEMIKKLEIYSLLAQEIRLIEKLRTTIQDLNTLADANDNQLPFSLGAIPIEQLDEEQQTQEQQTSTISSSFFLHLQQLFLSDGTIGNPFYFPHSSQILQQYSPNQILEVPQQRGLILELRQTIQLWQSLIDIIQLVGFEATIRYSVSLSLQQNDGLRQHPQNHSKQLHQQTTLTPFQVYLSTFEEMVIELNLLRPEESDNLVGGIPAAECLQYFRSKRRELEGKKQCICHILYENVLLRDSAVSDDLGLDRHHTLVKSQLQQQFRIAPSSSFPHSLAWIQAGHYQFVFLLIRAEKIIAETTLVGMAKQLQNSKFKGWEFYSQLWSYLHLKKEYFHRILVPTNFRDALNQYHHLFSTTVSTAGIDFGGPNISTSISTLTKQIELEFLKQDNQMLHEFYQHLVNPSTRSLPAPLQSRIKACEDFICALETNLQLKDHTYCQIERQKLEDLLITLSESMACSTSTDRLEFELCKARQTIQAYESQHQQSQSKINELQQQLKEIQDSLEQQCLLQVTDKAFELIFEYDQAQEEIRLLRKELANQRTAIENEIKQQNQLDKLELQKELIATKSEMQQYQQTLRDQLRSELFELQSAAVNKIIQDGGGSTKLKYDLLKQMQTSNDLEKVMNENGQLKQTLMKMKTMYELRETTVGSTHSKQLAAMSAQLNKTRHVFEQRDSLQDRLQSTQKQLFEAHKQVAQAQLKAETLTTQAHNNQLAKSHLIAFKVRYKKQTEKLQEQIQQLKDEGKIQKLQSEVALKKQQLIQAQRSEQLLKNQVQYLQTQYQRQCDIAPATNASESGIPGQIPPPNPQNNWQEEYDQMKQQYETACHKIKQLENLLRELNVPIKEFTSRSTTPENPVKMKARSSSAHPVYRHRNIVSASRGTRIIAQKPSAKVDSPRRPKSAVEYNSGKTRFQVRKSVIGNLPVQGQTRPMSPRPPLLYRD